MLLGAISRHQDILQISEKNLISDKFSVQQSIICLCYFNSSQMNRGGGGGGGRSLLLLLLLVFRKSVYLCMDLYFVYQASFLYIVSLLSKPRPRLFHINVTSLPPPPPQMFQSYMMSFKQCPMQLLTRKNLIIPFFLFYLPPFS